MVFGVWGRCWAPRRWLARATVWWSGSWLTPACPSTHEPSTQPTKLNGQSAGSLACRRNDAGRPLEGGRGGGRGEHGFDYLALLFALRAVGANPRPSLVVLAYTAAELLALLPFTPGGLGFVEAGLVGTLTLAGVPGSDALAATLLYRLAAYWLPIPAGGVAYLLFRHRYH